MVRHYNISKKECHIMPKRGENIRKRKDGRWEARYEKGRQQNGKIQYGYLYGRTYEEVKKKKLLALQQCGSPKGIHRKMYMKALCMEWKQSTRYTVKESSYASYDTLIEKHILPWFGDFLTEEISTDLINQFSMEKMQAGLSPRTVKTLMILLRNILHYGEQRGYLSLCGIQIRYPKIAEQPLHILPDDQIQQLISYLLEENSRISTGILLSIYTGIRVGELCGLQWKDIDFATGTMKINRTVSRIKNLEYHKQNNPRQPKTVVIVSTPKSLSSIRDIPIPEFLLKLLEPYRSNGDIYVLTDSTSCMEPRNVQRKFHAILTLCGIPSINIHSLRHAFATRCTQIGFDSKTLSEILGHSSVKITMDIYVHSSMQQKRNYMNQLCY